MSDKFNSFDSIIELVVDTLRHSEHRPIGRIYVIRDLHGKIRLAVSDKPKAVSDKPKIDEKARQWLKGKAKMLQERLGAYSFPPEDAILFLDSELFNELHQDGHEILPGVFLVDRLLTGAGWWSISSGASETPTYTLYSVKGGLGRSTTAAVLAWHLAKRGENVLVVDLDLESPGISSAMLDYAMQPRFGVVDWFVEDMVDQGDDVVEHMIARPSWHQDFPGDVCIVPAQGLRPGEYLAKLGRVYLDTEIRWTQRLYRMLQKLSLIAKPSIILLESRSGLHDIAAATVTDLNAHVLLFGTNSETSWQAYEILFKHWCNLNLAQAIREKLSIVSGLTPDINTEEYVKCFRERSWALFQSYLYDNVETSSEPYGFAFELLEDHAPHDPMPIHWTRGLAAGTSLRHLEDTTVEQAYSRFLERFDELQRMNARGGQ